MIYISNGGTVKEYHTDQKIEKAISTLLENTENIFYSESVEGCTVKVVDSEVTE